MASPLEAMCNEPAVEGQHWWYLGMGRTGGSLSVEASSVNVFNEDHFSHYSSDGVEHASPSHGVSGSGFKIKCFCCSRIRYCPATIYITLFKWTHGEWEYCPGYGIFPTFRSCFHCNLFSRWRQPKYLWWLKVGAFDDDIRSHYLKVLSSLSSEGYQGGFRSGQHSIKRVQFTLGRKLKKARIQQGERKNNRFLQLSILSSTFWVSYTLVWLRELILNKKSASYDGFAHSSRDRRRQDYRPSIPRKESSLQHFLGVPRDPWKRLDTPYQAPFWNTFHFPGRAKRLDTLQASTMALEASPTFWPGRFGGRTWNAPYRDAEILIPFRLKRKWTWLIC